MKFALVTADSAHMVRFKIDGNTGDATSFMNWVDVWQGVHLSFNHLNRKEDIDFLRTFDVVMFSGHPSHITKIIKFATELKDSKAVTIFYPEGSTQLYDNSINGFHIEYYDAWNACDIVSPAEEDKNSYYESFIRTNSIVRFIHVPLRREMEEFGFFVPREKKIENLTLVYGDNNPNHPMIALACANQLNLMVTGVELRNHLDSFQKMFPGVVRSDYNKQAQFPFLYMLAKTIIHIYPTEWIGTARQQIACACVGTPCIGNKDSHTQKRLFPALGTDIYDVEGMTTLAKKLIVEHDFYEEVVDHAKKNLEFYSLKKTKVRFYSAYEEVRLAKGVMTEAVG